MLFDNKNFYKSFRSIVIGSEKNTSSPIAQGIGVVPAVALRLTAVHIAAIFFLSGLLIATALLGAQYMFRYRKYHVARAEDLDSLADPSGKINNVFMFALQYYVVAIVLLMIKSLLFQHLYNKFPIINGKTNKCLAENPFNFVSNQI